MKKPGLRRVSLRYTLNLLLNSSTVSTERAPTKWTARGILETKLSVKGESPWHQNRLIVIHLNYVNALSVCCWKRDSYLAEHAAIKSITPEIGCIPDTLRAWLRQHERDSGMPGLTFDERQRLKERSTPAA